MVNEEAVYHGISRDPAAPQLRMAKTKGLDPREAEGRKGETGESSSTASYC